jgi:hypothetical protein
VYCIPSQGRALECNSCTASGVKYTTAGLANHITVFSLTGQSYHCIFLTGQSHQPPPHLGVAQRGERDGGAREEEIASEDGQLVTNLEVERAQAPPGRRGVQHVVVL